MNSLLWALSILLILAGIISTFLPALPGTVLVFLGLLVAAWIDAFTKVGVPTLIILGLLVLLSYGVDFLATLFGVKKLGASTLAVVGAAAKLALAFVMIGTFLLSYFFV
jgi:uncharacterized protein YqgC (DUF456 family)